MVAYVNDISLYYEKSGTGKPIILMHGNGESHRIFKKLVFKLNKYFTVYAIDTRGHGNSSKIKKLCYTDIAQDVIDFCIKLDLQAPIFYGFSDGGVAGLLAEIKKPNIFSHLIISGANTTPNAIIQKYLMPIRFFYNITKSDKYKLMLAEPNISAEMLSSIGAKTLVLAGEKDMIKLENTAFITNNIKNATSKILQGETHSSYVVDSDKLFSHIFEFVQ